MNFLGIVNKSSKQPARTPERVGHPFRKHQVKFSHVRSVKEIEKSNCYSHKERRASWWTRKEIDAMIDRSYRSAEKVIANPQMCSLGLERLSEEGEQRCSRNRAIAYDIVFDEQDAQWDEDKEEDALLMGMRPSPEVARERNVCALATLCGNITARPQRAAHIAGLRLEHEVHSYQARTRAIYNQFLFKLSKKMNRIQKSLPAQATHAHFPGISGANERPVLKRSPSYQDPLRLSQSMHEPRSAAMQQCVGRASVPFHPREKARIAPPRRISAPAGADTTMLTSRSYHGAGNLPSQKSKTSLVRRHSLSVANRLPEKINVVQATKQEASEEEVNAKKDELESEVSVMTETKEDLEASFASVDTYAWTSKRGVIGLDKRAENTDTSSRDTKTNLSERMEKIPSISNVETIQQPQPTMAKRRPTILSKRKKKKLAQKAAPSKACNGKGKTKAGQNEEVENSGEKVDGIQATWSLVTSKSRRPDRCISHGLSTLLCKAEGSKLKHETSDASDTASCSTDDEPHLMEVTNNQRMVVMPSGVICLHVAGERKLMRGVRTIKYVHKMD